MKPVKVGNAAIGGEVIGTRWKIALEIKSGHDDVCVYTHLVQFESDEYVCKVAGTVKEAAALIERGFEYVTEIERLKLFRKRK
jgi:hypothetical protein